MATPSDLLYDAVWHKPSTRRNACIAIPNGPLAHDYFVFAPESEMDESYELLRQLVGSCELPIADRSLWLGRQDSLEHVYRRFFRRRAHDVAAFWWIWGRVPVHSLNRPMRVGKREEGLFSFRANSVREGRDCCHLLSLSGGRNLDVPLALLEPVESKLTQRISFQRQVSIRELDSGAFVGAEFHDEIQLGTLENARAIASGQFWVQAADADIVPLVQARDGRWYSEAFAVYLVRAIPVWEVRGGPRYSTCRFEAVYISYRLLGCPNKVGVIRGSFNAWAMTSESLFRALHQVNPFGKWA